MTAFRLYVAMKFTCSLFIHGNHCHTVRQRLDSEQARILYLGFLRVKVYNFLCLNLGEKAINVQGRCKSSIIRCFVHSLSLIWAEKIQAKSQCALNPYQKCRQNRILKAKSLQVVLVEFSRFLGNVKDQPFNYKKPLFYLKKVDYKYLK